MPVLIARKPKDNGTKFAIFMIVSTTLFVVLSVLFIFYGAEKVAFADIFRGLFAYDPSNFHHIIVRDIRLPRLIADVIVGVSLAVSGAVMQGNTKNPMADTGIMGVNSGSIAAIIFIVAFMPNVTRLERIGISCLGAAIATGLIYLVALSGKRGMTAERLVLAGMAVSTLFSSVTTAIVLKEGLSNQLIKYTAGSSANTIWLDIKIAAPFFIAGFVLSLAISRSLTVMSLGDDVSKGLGANILLIKTLSTIVVLVLSAIAVVIIGPVGYVGLMVPHIVRYFVGTDYRRVLPASAIMGAAMVVLVDLVARLLIAPLEFPVGILLTMIGVPFFIFISRRQKRDTFGN